MIQYNVTQMQSTHNNCYNIMQKMITRRRKLKFSSTHTKQGVHTHLTKKTSSVNSELTRELVSSHKSIYEVIKQHAE
jgi:hypothetical protein